MKWNHSFFIVLLLLLVACSSSKKTTADINLGAAIQPVPKYSILEHKDYWVWGASMVQTDDGLCHLFYSRWPKAGPFSDWLLKSEIAYATAKKPEGPYTFQKVMFKNSIDTGWGTTMAHNPHVQKFDNKYYLYFISTRLKDWDLGARQNHTFSQRIGVAVADKPDGEWKIIPNPIVDIQPGKPATGYVTNPSVSKRPDGTYLMMFKSRPSNWKEIEKFTAIQCLATSPTPIGPFTILDNPVLTEATAEDPFMWYQNNRYYAIADDQYGDYLPNGHGLALFESKDARHWALAENPVVSYPQIKWVDNTVMPLKHLERPQLFFNKKGKPAVLFCAAMDSSGTRTFNVHIPLQPMAVNKK
ncbi:MAG: glycoside hydrolase family protein [Niabella sp.]